jgi:pimeloyl-ACP methyl ester carboxylesterase
VTTFVLVHGHCHGAWCWERVTPGLTATGHRVFTPTLVGMGERVASLSRATGLTAHIADLDQWLRDQDLEDITLVGHSYAGMVITGVASRSLERVRQLVYIDGPVPRDGESLFDCLPGLTDLFRASAVDGWRLDPPDPNWWGVTAEPDREWVANHVTPIAIATCEERLDAPGNPTDRIPRTYLRCTGSSLPETIVAKLRDQPGWRVEEIDGAHDAMITNPDAVIRALLACCR